MGVGVYRDSFHGAGRTINVDGVLGGDAEAYEAYCNEEREAGEEPLSQEEWDRDQYDDHNEGLLNVVEAVCDEVGLSSDREGRFGGGRVDFDREFTGIASNGVFAVGWRSWEHDYVVAVGPSGGLKDMAQNVDSYGPEILREIGLAPTAFKALYDATLGGFEELLRLNLLKSGLETARPTSSYTQARDVAPDDIDARMEALVASVKSGIESLSQPASARIAGMAEPEARVELAKAILAVPADEAHELPKVMVATYARGGAACLWDPSVTEGSGLMVSATVPAELRGYMDGLPRVDDDVAPIPCNDETRAWFAARQARVRDNDVILSAEQYAEITGEACVVSWTDDDEGTKGTLTLAEAPAPQAAPGA